MMRPTDEAHTHQSQLDPLHSLFCLAIEESQEGLTLLLPAIRLSDAA